jgi:glucosamine kinase
MIAIVDSGSTKSSWVFVDRLLRKHEFKTVGFNPYYQNSEEIFQTISKDLLPLIPTEETVEEIHFYGAGCERASQKLIVANGIKKAFPLSEVHVDHDMLAAARSLFGHKPGIACIAGTGANTCYYNGTIIIENIYSPGLALADEGSGGFLGKLLARDYIRKALPEHLMKKFEEFTSDRLEDILDKVYKKPFPNRYLASLAPFVVKHQEDPYMFRMAYENFEQMFKQCICRYEKHTTLPIRFIGSIAAHLRPVLDKVAEDKGLKVDKVVANPMEGLVDFHLQKINT